MEPDQCPTCNGDAVKVFDVDTQRMVVEHLRCPQCNDGSEAQDRPISAIDESDNAFFHLARLHARCWEDYQTARASEQPMLHDWHEGSFVSMVG